MSPLLVMPLQVETRSYAFNKKKKKNTRVVAYASFAAVKMWYEDFNETLVKPSFKQPHTTILIENWPRVVLQIESPNLKIINVWQHLLNK